MGGWGGGRLLGGGVLGEREREGSVRVLVYVTTVPLNCSFQMLNHIDLSIQFPVD